MVWRLSFCFMAQLAVLCNDKMIDAFLCLFFSFTINTPLWKQLITNKMSPISGKLVTGFWRSWTVIGGSFWSDQVSVWWKSEECAAVQSKTQAHTLCVSLSYLNAHLHSVADFTFCPLPNSIPAENVSAPPSRRQRHDPKRWWRVWNRFVLFYFSCLLARGKHDEIKFPPDIR